MNTGAIAMKHDWKPGDIVGMKLKEVDESGDFWFESGMIVDGAYADSFIATAPPDHSQYIGKTLADVPDGTVAVVHNGDMSDTLAVVNGDVYGLDKKLGPCEAPHIDVPDQWEVLHIIKLGEPKPVTLAEAVKAATARATVDSDTVEISKKDWAEIGKALNLEERTEAR